MSTHVHFFCGSSVDSARRAMFAAFFCAILASTFAFGTDTTRFNSRSNDRSAFATMILSGEAHKTCAILAGECAIGETTTEHAGQHFAEPLPVCVLAFVESEHLLGDVARQVERSNRDVCTAERAFEQRPEVFEAVGRPA